MIELTIFFYNMFCGNILDHIILVYEQSNNVIYPFFDITSRIENINIKGISFSSDFYSLCFKIQAQNRLNSI